MGGGGNRSFVFCTFTASTLLTRCQFFVRMRIVGEIILLIFVWETHSEIKGKGEEFGCRRTDVLVTHYLYVEWNATIFVIERFSVG